MRHWWIYIILYGIVGVFSLSPFQGTDVAKLAPAEAVWIEMEEGSVRMETDGNDVGVGKTVSEALKNMKETATGTVFLDTADYLIVKKGSEALLSQVRDILRPSCRVCTADGMPDLTDAAAFLSVHEPSVKLNNIGNRELPHLAQEKGRMTLIEKEYSDTAADSMADRCDNRSDLKPCRKNWMDHSCT